MRSSYGVGRYHVGEPDMLCASDRRLVAGERRGCLFFNGLGVTAAFAAREPNTAPLLDAIGNVMPTVNAHYGNVAGFGNTGMTTLAEEARTYLVASGAKSDKVVLAGISQGSATALRYAMAFPSRVAAIALVLPVPDLQMLYDNGFSVQLDAAYGHRPTNAENPASNPGAFAGISIEQWYSTDDPTALPAGPVAFSAATGAALHSLGPVGHTCVNIDAGGLAQFLFAHGA